MSVGVSVGEVIFVGVSVRGSTGVSVCVTGVVVDVAASVAQELVPAGWLADRPHGRRGEKCCALTAETAVAMTQKSKSAMAILRSNNRCVHSR